MHSSWIAGANRPSCDFPLANLPYGVFSMGGDRPRCAVAIGDQLADLAALERAGLIEAQGFDQTSLNAFMSKGPTIWAQMRARLGALFAQDGDGALRDNPILHREVLFDLAQVDLHLPIDVTGFTDFFAGRQHALNSGAILRGAANALTPNWPHMPIAYNGRCSTVVVSGTDLHRPLGQTRPDADAPPRLGPSQWLDLEVEFGAIVGTPTQMGETLSVAQAWDHIFGYVLLNDWSARDIQRWEGQPLGPFQSKAFATTISPWVVTKAALESARRPAPERDTALLPYLHEEADYFYDITIEAHLTPQGAAKSSRFITTNTQHLYYSAPQLLAHHALNGCKMNTGDLLGSGTISGPERENFGCLMEQTWAGRDEVVLENGGVRTFLEDGDLVSLRGWSEIDGVRIGFGRCEGRILPAPPRVGGQSA